MENNNEVFFQQCSFLAPQDFTKDYIYQFLDYLDCKDDTAREYFNCLRRYAEWLKSCGITQPTRDDIKAYRKYLEDQKYTVATQVHYLNVVRLFHRWAYDSGYYPNVAEHLHTAKMRHDIHRRDTLPLDDSVKKIGDSIDRSTEQGKRLYCMFMIDITCGTRCVELHRADVKDLKTVGGNSYLYIQGKGHEEKDAPVELVPELKEAIDDYLLTRKAPATPDMPLFTATSNRNVAGRIATTTISKMLKKLLVDNGYDSDRLTAHSLRHTANTAAYFASGKNIYEAQKFARHVSPETTEIYVHAEDRKDRHTEQQVYDYLFSDKSESNAKREQLLRLVSELPADELDKVLEYVEMLKK